MLDYETSCLIKIIQTRVKHIKVFSNFIYLSLNRYWYYSVLRIFCKYDTKCFEIYLVVFTILGKFTSIYSADMGNSRHNPAWVKWVNELPEKAPLTQSEHFMFVLPTIVAFADVCPIVTARKSLPMPSANHLARDRYSCICICIL